MIFFPHSDSGNPCFLPASDSILHWSLRVLCFYSEEAGGIVEKPSLDGAHITSAHLPLDKDPTRENTQPYVDAGRTGRCSGWLETLLPVPTSSCGSREPNLWRRFYPHLVLLMATSLLQRINRSSLLLRLHSDRMLSWYLYHLIPLGDKYSKAGTTVYSAIYFSAPGPILEQSIIQ